jgi:CheY-like chemotaxis protein
MDTSHYFLQGGAWPMNGKRILIVDDNPSVLKGLSMLLAPHGYQTMLAADGGQAAAMVRRERPDLILLDVTFPPDVGYGGGVPWDGFLILDWLRRIPEAKDVPFVVISGGDPLTLSTRSRAAGAAAFLHKPIHSAELLLAIRHGLREPVPQTETTG